MATSVAECEPSALYIGGIETAARVGLADRLVCVPNVQSARFDARRPGSILLDQDLPERERVQALCWAAKNRCSVWRLAGASTVLQGERAFIRLHGAPVVLLLAPSPRWRTAAVRALDILSALLLGVCALPLMVLIAALVGATDGWPIFYRQKRVGLHGQVFTLVKFRTMIRDAERLTGPRLTEPQDPAITPVGRFLRSSRLDELPQVWNVLRGDMRLVGPRPERPEFVDQFRLQYPAYDLRHTVKPGITGLAQVEGTYSSPVADKLVWDLTYVNGATVLTDLWILLRTVRVVLAPSKSAAAPTTTPVSHAPLARRPPLYTPRRRGG